MLPLSEATDHLAAVLDAKTIEALRTLFPRQPYYTPDRTEAAIRFAEGAQHVIHILESLVAAAGAESPPPGAEHDIRDDP